MVRIAIMQKKGISGKMSVRYLSKTSRRTCPREILLVMDHKKIAGIYYYEAMFLRGEDGLVRECQIKDASLLRAYWKSTYENQCQKLKDLREEYTQDMEDDDVVDLEATRMSDETVATVKGKRTWTEWRDLFEEVQMEIQEIEREMYSEDGREDDTGSD